MGPAIYGGAQCVVKQARPKAALACLYMPFICDVVRYRVGAGAIAASIPVRTDTGLYV